MGDYIYIVASRGCGKSSMFLEELKKVLQDTEKEVKVVIPKKKKK